MLCGDSAAGVAELDADKAFCLRFIPMGSNRHAAICLQRVKRIRHERDKRLLHLALVHIYGRQRSIELLDNPHFSKFWMMLYELKSLFDNLINIACKLVGLTLVGKLKQAICDCLAPESFVANDLKILAEVFMQRDILEIFD